VSATKVTSRCLSLSYARLCYEYCATIRQLEYVSATFYIEYTILCIEYCVFICESCVLNTVGFTYEVCYEYCEYCVLHTVYNTQCFMNTKYTVCYDRPPL